MHDFLAVEDAHNHDDACHGHNHVERGFDQVVEFQLVFQRGGKHGQQHDGEEVRDVVAGVEETVGAAVEACLHALVVQKPFKEHRLDAAVDTHQQNQQGKRQTLAQDFLEKLEVDLETESFGMAQDDGKGKNKGDDVGHGLRLQIPDGVESFHREPTAPQHEAHDDDGQHTVEDGEDTVLLKEQQPLYVRPEEEDEGEQDLVEATPAQQLEFQAFVVAAEITDDEDDDSIEQSQQEFDFGEAAEVFREVLRVLRDVAAVEVGDAEVEQDVEEVGKVKQGLVGAVGGIAEDVLHLTVDAENPERLHQQVEKQQENNIFYEAVLHLCVQFMVCNSC